MINKNNQIWDVYHWNTNTSGMFKLLPELQHIQWFCFVFKSACKVYQATQTFTTLRSVKETITYGKDTKYQIYLHSSIFLFIPWSIGSFVSFVYTMALKHLTTDLHTNFPPILTIRDAAPSCKLLFSFYLQHQACQKKHLIIKLSFNQYLIRVT